MQFFGAGNGKKDPGETVTLTLDFAPDLATGETLTGTPTAAIALFSGAPHAGIDAMLTGAAQRSGSLVLQSCLGGIAGNQYDIKATCPTSAGRVLVVGAILPVTDAALM